MVAPSSNARPSASRSSQNASNLSAAVRVERVGLAAQLRHAPLPLAFEALQHLAPQRAARAPGREREVGAVEAGVVAGREREPQVRERGAGAGAVQHRDAHRRPARHAGFAEQELHGQQHGVHAAQHRDVVRAARPPPSHAVTRSTAARASRSGAVVTTDSASSRSASRPWRRRSPCRCGAGCTTAGCGWRRRPVPGSGSSWRARGACRRGSSGRS